MSIYIENEYDNDVPPRYYEVVKEVIEAALDFVKCPYECEVNVIFTGNEGIQEINKEYRNIDAPTDVLSFPLVDYKVPGDFSNFEDDLADNFNQDSGELMLGDIILNIDKIDAQSIEYGHSKIRELAFLTAHSMLHLSGFDHVDDDMRIEMERNQENILNMKGYTRDYEEN